MSEPSPGHAEEAVRAFPSGFSARGNLLWSLLPAPPTHPLFPPLSSFWPSSAGGAAQRSSLPHPPPPQYRATFALSKLSHRLSVQTLAQKGRGRSRRSSRPRMPPLAPTPPPRRPCPCRCRCRCRPPGEATLPAAAALSLPGTLPRGPDETGWWCDLERRGPAPPVYVAPGLQCPSRAPWVAGAVGEAWAPRFDGLRYAAQEAGPAAAAACSEPEGLPASAVSSATASILHTPSAGRP